MLDSRFIEVSWLHELFKKSEKFTSLELTSPQAISVVPTVKSPRDKFLRFMAAFTSRS